MRFRITVRGASPRVELRGLVEGDGERLLELAEAMRPFGVVVASPAEDDYWPWSVEEEET